jgi:hypothetical protein
MGRHAHEWLRDLFRLAVTQHLADGRDGRLERRGEVGGGDWHRTMMADLPRF